MWGTIDEEKLEQALEESRASNGPATTVAFKTVDTFAGITRRKLWLKDGAHGETDGHAISAPFKNPNFYSIVEHELAHILFKSDAIARQKFIEDYTALVSKVTKKAGASIEEGSFAGLLEGIIGILEDHRVNSLWGLLYEGSYAIMKAANYEIVSGISDRAGSELLVYMCCVETGVDTPLRSKYHKFQPYIAEAFRKVQKRGFEATLLTTKWLVTQMVSELLRTKKDKPSPEMPPQLQQFLQQLKNKQDGSKCPKQNGGGSGGKQGDPEGDSGDNQDCSGDGDSKEGDQGSDSSSDADPTDGKDQGWYPEPEQASLEERAQALKDLADGAGDLREKRKHADVVKPRFPSRSELKNAENVSKVTSKLDVNKGDKMDAFMAASKDRMENIADSAKNAVRNVFHEDEYLKKDAMARIVFQDVSSSKEEFNVYDTDQDYDPMREDRATVQRLRSQFFRVMGKRKAQLQDYGCEVDVPALLERKLTGEPMPVFRSDELGRGFKAMLLLDRSGSMMGSRTTYVERASKILSRAMKFPFVELDIWGFRSTESGQVDIDRYDRRNESFSNNTGRSRVGGVTPIHIASRVARKALERSTAVRHMFILTDGFPVYSGRKGYFPTWQLMVYTRQEVEKARKAGIGVTGVLIGNDLSPKHLGYMFGHHRHWRVLGNQRFGSDLVQLVTSSFVDFLKNG